MRTALQRIDEAIEALVKAGVARSSAGVVMLEVVRRELMEHLYGFAPRETRF